MHQFKVQTFWFGQSPTIMAFNTGSFNLNRYEPGRRIASTTLNDWRFFWDLTTHLHGFSCWLRRQEITKSSYCLTTARHFESVCNRYTVAKRYVTSCLCSHWTEIMSKYWMQLPLDRLLMQKCVIFRTKWAILTLCPRLVTFVLLKLM